MTHESGETCAYWRDGQEECEGAGNEELVGSSHEPRRVEETTEGCQDSLSVMMIFIAENGNLRAQRILPHKHSKRREPGGKKTLRKRHVAFVSFASGRAFETRNDRVVCKRSSGESDGEGNSVVFFSCLR